MRLLFTLVLMLLLKQLMVAQVTNTGRQLFHQDTIRVTNIFLSAEGAKTDYSKYFKKEASISKLSFQVAPMISEYQESIMVGYSLGFNFFERLNVSYFHSRDYDFGQDIFDNRWAGLHVALVFPVLNRFEFGPTVRFSEYNNRPQQTFYGAELRLDIGDYTKIGFEYGVADTPGTSIKFIWNLY